ncbi:hypothetical protein DBR43_32650 [Pedobacter sp. KBW06]|nr:hypothetical protein DBR43_32650 [Pedobacter sp. KBW06]
MQKGFIPYPSVRFFLIKNDRIKFLMRFSFVLTVTTLIFVSLLFAREGHSQGLDQAIRLSIKNAGMKESILAIEKESGIRFLMRDDLIKGYEKKLTISSPKITVRHALEQVLSGTPLTYVELNGFVSVVTRSAQFLITGRVIDEKTKESLIGVSVRIKGAQASTFTDNQGNFSLKIPGYGVTLQFQSIGYQSAEVRVDDARSVQNVGLKILSTALKEVTVHARRKANTEAAVLDERRLSGIVQDAISAQQIERTASITTTQALQRVTGVTVTDEKFVAIRGLGERSVIAQLNGVRLASSDPDRTSIPLDLVPASLLDNITVYKTVTPDKPADAASGIIELKTKSIPESQTFEVVAQSGFNSNVGFRGNYNSFYNSDMGILGTRINDKNLRPDFLALSEKYPDGLGSVQKLIANTNYSLETQKEVNRINSIMQSFDPALKTGYQKAPLNQLYSMTYGNNFKVFKKHKIGLILGGNYYRRITDTYQGDLTQYSIYQGVITGNKDVYSFRNIPNYVTPNGLYMGKYQTYKENTGAEILNYGVLGGLAYRFNERHEISAQYMGSWGGENTATNLAGGYQYSGLPGAVSSDIYSIKQSYRTLNIFNIQGEHKITKGLNSPQLSYNIASSNSSQNEPDYRFVTLANYTPTGGGWYMRPQIAESGVGGIRTYSKHLYALSSGYVNGFGAYGIIQAEPNGRRWRKLEEKNYNYKADLSIPFNLFGQKQEFKTGVNYLFRERSFTENHLLLPGSNFNRNGALPLYDVEGDLNRLVSNEVIGVHAPLSGQGEGMMPIGGFLYNSQKSPNNYKGYYETNAVYTMLDVRLSEKIRLAGGVRFEMTSIGSVVDTSNVFLDPALSAPTADGSKIPLILVEPNSVHNVNYKPYYSLNLNYSLHKNMNFRAAFNTTLARPELREITNVFEFDAFQMGLVIGNPKLVNQHTQNLDFRWEWFPNSGEVLAFSVFGKQIDNQLVRVFNLKTDGLAATYPEFPTIQYQNDENTGKVWGIEMEIVKDLERIWYPLKNFFVGSNMMLARSLINKSTARYNAGKSLDRHTPKNSPLFEQAPYSINSWLNYTNKKTGTDLTTSFNMVGERLVQINLTGEPDLYTRPVPMLDFVFSQRLAKKVLFKGYAKNILNPNIQTVYANPGTGGKWYGNEYLNRSFKRGMEVMLGFTYNLF